MKRIMIGFALAATPAAAGELRDFCADRPGLGTSPCVVDAGHVVVEVGLAYRHDKNRDTVDDEQDYGELTARLGVTQRLEVSLGWTAHTRFRSRDRASGGVSRHRGGDDLMLGAKLALTDPDAKRSVSVSVQGFATAPTGSDGIGTDGWTQGVIVPIAFDLAGGLTVELSPEAERLPNIMRPGHHLVYTFVAGLGRKFGPFDAQIEVLFSRDNDVDAPKREAVAAANLARAIGENAQVDAEVDVGLSRDAPDVRVAVGLARRF